MDHCLPAQRRGVAFISSYEKVFTVEIVSLKKVIFGLGSGLLLGVAAVTVLDERLVRPMRCDTPKLHFSLTHIKPQAYDIPVILLLPAHLDSAKKSTHFIDLSSAHSWPNLIRSRSQSFDVSLANQLLYNRPLAESEASMGESTLLHDDEQDLWNGIDSQSFALSYTPRAYKLARIATNPWKSNKVHRPVGGGKNRFEAPTPKEAPKKSVAVKKGLPAPAKRNVGKKGKSRKGIAIALKTMRGRRGKRLRVKGQGRLSQSISNAPLIHLKPIAPGAKIKPQKAYDSWKKLRKHPIFTWPLDPAHFWVSSEFGPRKKTNGAWALHAGVDLAAVRGTPVRASREGTVMKAAYSSGYGNYILIEHSKKYQTRYAHLDKILVKVGQKVCAGDCIGKVGATGFVRKSRWGSSGAHLHFEVYVWGKPKNPFSFLA